MYNLVTWFQSDIMNLSKNFIFFAYTSEHAVAQCLRHCVTTQNVAGSFPDGVIEFFHWHHPSGSTMALGSTQPLTEMSTRNIPWGWRRPVRRACHLHVPIFLKSEILNLLEPSGSVKACKGKDRLSELIRHWSHEGLLHPCPWMSLLHSSPEALHTKQAWALSASSARCNFARKIVIYERTRFFYMLGHGTDVLLPLRRKASVGSELAILGTRGLHANH
jgi:hypothetical protein